MYHGISSHARETRKKEKKEKKKEKKRKYPGISPLACSAAGRKKKIEKKKEKKENTLGSLHWPAAPLP